MQSPADLHSSHSRFQSAAAGVPTCAPTCAPTPAATCAPTCAGSVRATAPVAAPQQLVRPASHSAPTHIDLTGDGDMPHMPREAEMAPPPRPPPRPSVGGVPPRGVPAVLRGSNAPPKSMQDVEQRLVNLDKCDDGEVVLDLQVTPPPPPPPPPCANCIVIRE